MHDDIIIIATEDDDIIIIAAEDDVIMCSCTDAELYYHGRCVASLVPRPSRKAERGSGVLSDISWRMGRGYTA